MFHHTHLLLCSTSLTCNCTPLFLVYVICLPSSWTTVCKLLTVQWWRLSLSPAPGQVITHQVLSEELNWLEIGASLPVCDHKALRTCCEGVYDVTWSLGVSQRGTVCWAVTFVCCQWLPYSVSDCVCVFSSLQMPDRMRTATRSRPATSKDEAKFATGLMIGECFSYCIIYIEYLDTYELEGS